MTTHYEAYCEARRRYPDTLMFVKTDIGFVGFNGSADELIKLKDEGANLQCCFRMRGDGRQMVDIEHDNAELIFKLLIEVGFRVAICDPLKLTDGTEIDQ